MENNLSPTEDYYKPTIQKSLLFAVIDVLEAVTNDIDLSTYATKKQAISNIDLSAYATTEYVDNAIANIPSGGEINLENYYTKEETFSPTAIVTKEGNIATITIIDKNGTTTTSISDGKDGTGGGGSGSEEIYSTEEIEAGTWIDEKTIYRKVIEIGKLGAVSSENYGLIKQGFSDADTDMIINMKALLSYSKTRVVVEGSFFCN